MPTEFSSHDLGRVFEPRALTRGRSLTLIGAVQVQLDGETIRGVVEDLKVRYIARVKPRGDGERVGFDTQCTCHKPGCPHRAATALAALERFPELRRAEPKGLFDAMPKPADEASRAVFELSPGMPPHACFVTTALAGERTGRLTPITPRALASDPACPDDVSALAGLLGAGDSRRTAVPPAQVAKLLALLGKSGRGRWHANGRKLVPGVERIFEADTAPKLPAKSAVILGEAGPWYVDAATGAVGRVRLRRRLTPAPAKPRRSAVSAAPTERVIEERPPAPLMRLARRPCPDENGRPALTDTLSLAFTYGNVVIEADDARQFIRIETAAGPTFLRRDPDTEAAAFETLRQDGFVTMRVPAVGSAKGTRVLAFHGREAPERWQRFMAERMPALELQGWTSRVENGFGPRMASISGLFDMQVADAEAGAFSLEFGIEIDGVRRPLLPILSRLLDAGGYEAATIVGDELVTSLDDGRVVKLPAEKMRRLLAVMTDLIESSQRMADGAIVLPGAEAAAVVDLEDLLVTRWQDSRTIELAVARVRGVETIPPAPVPASFTVALRPYQQHGVDWLQHLRANGLGGFLADDMGLGKTAQTIAHIAIEQAAGRLDRPALIVVPTSLVPNWTAELAKFAPGLRLEVLHGMDRHARRSRLDGVHVVITTYTVLARDLEEMRDLAWHLVVLDEAQAVKNPDAKATRAVCQLDARQRICLSGTPIENNLDELWSQFAFLMPGLLGDRRGFTKRFRTPIEKGQDETRRLQLVRRIRPFILRRTKAEVATELPPKHTILRRITLASDQRELYETIRGTLYDRVREQIAERSLAQSRIVVLDALLKLRQACCDPRLVKLASARATESSSKLDDLMEMLGEMLPEGRRVLLFSQFTSMLDLIKPRLKEAGIAFVELRGDTRDRAEPVRSFEAGEVPLFLISLKAGGRGLNLISADTVIHYDPWWNPAVEAQASDRAHRIGQTKSVFVYKMIAADTVEERILELQERKANLASIAFSEESDVAALEIDDIDYLFGADRLRDAA
jgi:superfamily II DNA or RNA helicase